MNLYRKLSDRLNGSADGFGPVKGRLPLPRMGMIWLAANLVVTTLLTGTLLFPGLEYPTTLLVIVLGTLGGAVVLTLIGNMGTRTGLPTMALTRGAFGVRGSLLPVAANVIVLMGWSWVQAMLAGVTVNALVASLTGFSNPVLFSMLCQALVVTLAVFGHEGIEKAEPWFALAILAVMTFVFINVFSQHSFGDLASIPADPAIVTPTIGLDIVISTAISWTVLSADFNRLARNSKAGIIGSGVGYSLSTIIAMTLGATAIGAVVLRGGEATAFDPVVLVNEFGAPIAIVIFLSVMATNTMVVFGMVTSVVNAQSKWRIRFLPAALVLGGISILGASWLALLNQFTDFLVMIGAFFVPVFAIMIADYYIVRRASYTRDLLKEKPASSYWFTGGVNWWAVAVWVVGAVASYVWTYVWPLAIGATIPAFVLSFALYLAITLPTSKRMPHHPSRHLADAEQQ